MTLRIATCLWDANKHSHSFSRMYDETWVEKLYRGFARNLTKPFEFYCFTDRERKYNEPINHMSLIKHVPDYGSFIEPFCLHGPLMVVGLDTIITGNIDHLAEYCENNTQVAAVRDPYQPERLINPIILTPYGHRYIYERWGGENDMDHLRNVVKEWKAIDVLWPGEVVSLKFHQIRKFGIGKARIVYFHGNPKPNEISNLEWIKEHWR